jgi:hypothetical protein
MEWGPDKLRISLESEENFIDSKKMFDIINGILKNLISLFG